MSDLLALWRAATNWCPVCHGNGSLRGPTLIVGECLACRELAKRVQALEARLAADAHASRDHEADYVAQARPPRETPEDPK